MMMDTLLSSPGSLRDRKIRGSKPSLAQEVIILIQSKTKRLRRMSVFWHVRLLDIPQEISFERTRLSLI